MTRTPFRKMLNAARLAGAALVATPALAQPSQGGPGNGMGPGMMGGHGFGWMGGYGGVGLPILLVIVIAGLVAWIIKNKGK